MSFFGIGGENLQVKLAIIFHGLFFLFIGHLNSAFLAFLVGGVDAFFAFDWILLTSFCMWGTRWVDMYGVSDLNKVYCMHGINRFVPSTGERIGDK